VLSAEAKIELYLNGDLIGEASSAPEG